MMTKKITIRIISTLVLVIAIFTEFTIYANENSKQDKKKFSLSKSSSFIPQDYALLNINNLTTWQRKDGKSNHSPNDKNGVSFPRGTTTCVYQDGILWGAKAYVDSNMTIPAPFEQKIRVGGSTYGTGCQAGWVEGFGAAALSVSQEDSRNRIFRIRRDWQEMSDEGIRQDAAECFEIPVSDVTDEQINIILDDYKWCWENWPVDLGAPFIDRNTNGIYDHPPPFNTDVPKNDPFYFGPKELISKNYDEPGLTGDNPNTPADQVIWAIWNDLNRSMRFGSEPIGLETQSTLWGYKRKDEFGDIIFRKIKLINKGGVETDDQNNLGSFYLDSMYVCQWSDPDLGDSGDDLVGCDTTLDLGYLYNKREIDAKYQEFNLPPPAVGYTILQGPIIPSNDDKAFFNFKYKKGYKNLGMSSFAYDGIGDPYSSLSGIDYNRGTILAYKMLRGYALLSYWGQEDWPDTRYRFPPGMTPGPFPLAGDPVYGVGHIDGLGEDYSFVAGDKRLYCSSGPFQMAPGDTQEVIIALVVGLGSDRLSSISKMKFTAEWARSIASWNYDIGTEKLEPLIEGPIPQNYHLCQNFPNPLQTGTNIQYDLPAQRFVNLSIYNLLGQKVKTLVEEIQNPKIYSYSWNGKNSFGQRVPNGMYFYRLEAGAVVLTKKLMIVE
jgi:hypothetical protein